MEDKYYTILFLGLLLIYLAGRRKDSNKENEALSLYLCGAMCLATFCIIGVSSCQSKFSQAQALKAKNYDYKTNQKENQK